MKCPECGNPKSHNAYCSQAKTNPTPGRKQPGPDPRKQNFKKRDDDKRGGGKKS